MSEPLSTNPALGAWVRAVVEYARPDRVHWCVGTSDERAEIASAMVAAGQLIRLDAEVHPRSFLYRTDPDDAEPTPCNFVSTHNEVDAGPTNQWMSRDEVHGRVWPLFQDSMRGRTMYVVPYLMGPPHSPFSSVGIQITDSPYVVLCLGLMTRMGRTALDLLDGARHFVRGVHSLGDLSSERRFLVHFPDRAEVWSIGSGNVTNALLSKHAHSLRIASVQAREGGWLAEHMSLLSLTNPEGQTQHIAVAESNVREKADFADFADFAGSRPGWTLEFLSNDVCWMRPGNDGQLWGINPDVGRCDGVTALNSRQSQNLPGRLPSDVLFTNVALRAGGRVWWEGLEKLGPGEVVEDWRGMSWTQQAARAPAAHPQASFAMAHRTRAGGLEQIERNHGVPISAVLFCSGQACGLPLVYEARSWRHGVFVGASLMNGVDSTASRHDPMAMRDFCGYNIGDYLNHWLSIGRNLNRPPKFFHVNWFRSTIDGRQLWPGGAENIRVLKWILERVDGTASARSSPLGYVPTQESFDLKGLDVPQDRLTHLFAGNSRAALQHAGRALEFFGRFRDRLPAALLAEHRALIRRLQESLH